MFNNTKIRIKSAAHSKLVQEALFKAGFKWGGYEAKVTNTSMPFLFIYEDLKVISFSESHPHFLQHNHKEIFYPPKIKTIKD